MRFFAGPPGSELKSPGPSFRRNKGGPTASPGAKWEVWRANRRGSSFRPGDNTRSANPCEGSRCAAPTNCLISSGVLMGAPSRGGSDLGEPPAEQARKNSDCQLERGQGRAWRHGARHRPGGRHESSRSSGHSGRGSTSRGQATRRSPGVPATPDGGREAAPRSRATDPASQIGPPLIRTAPHSRRRGPLRGRQGARHTTFRFRRTWETGSRSRCACARADPHPACGTSHRGRARWCRPPGEERSWW